MMAILKMSLEALLQEEKFDGTNAENFLLEHSFRIFADPKVQQINFKK